MTYQVSVFDGYNPAESGVMIADSMSLYTASFLAKGLSNRNHDGTFCVVDNRDDSTKESWKHGVNQEDVKDNVKASKLYR